MDSLMYLVHDRFGKRICWALHEQNMLLTEGWREVTAEDFRAHPGSLNYPTEIVMSIQAHRH